MAEEKDIADRTAEATEAGIDRRTHTGNGTDAVERRVNRLQEVVKECKAQALHMMIYDIPDVKNKECPNPSWLLWHYGFRLNLSCWVLPDKSLAARDIRGLLAHWKNHNIEVHIIPYAESALAQIRAIAQEKLRQEVNRQYTSFLERLASASDRLDATTKSLNERVDAGEKVPAIFYEREESKKDNQTRAIIREAGKHLNAALDCARMFDEYENLEDLFTGLRAVISAEAESFNAEMELKNSKPVESLAIPDTNTLVKDCERWDFTPLKDEKTVVVIYTKHGCTPVRQDMPVVAARKVWVELTRTKGFKKLE